MLRWLSRVAPAAAVVALLVSSSGCAAVFPEIQMRLAEAPATLPPDTPIPDDRLFVQIVSGTVPPRTRDGRTWDQVFGSLPDPYVKVKLEGVEIIRTDPDADTLEPKWDSSPKGNFRIAVGDKLEVELWDSSALNDTPIGLKKLTVTTDMVNEGEVELALSGDATVTMRLGPARPLWGAGFWFDLRNSSSYVTHVLDASPASRAGMQSGDRIVALDGKPVESLGPDGVRSVLLSMPVAGVAMTLQHGDGATLQATIKEGPIFPLYEEQRRMSVADR